MILKKIKPYLMICMIQCLTSGIHAKISNLSGINIHREINNIISYISNTFDISEPDQILIIENMIKKKLHKMSNPSSDTGGPSTHTGGPSSHRWAI